MEKEQDKIKHKNWGLFATLCCLIFIFLIWSIINTIFYSNWEDIFAGAYAAVALPICAGLSCIGISTVFIVFSVRLHPKGDKKSKEDKLLDVFNIMFIVAYCLYGIIFITITGLTFVDFNTCYIMSTSITCVYGVIGIICITLYGVVTKRLDKTSQVSTTI